MHVVACRYDSVAVTALLDAGATLTLVIDAWEASHRPPERAQLERLAALHVVADFDDMTEVGRIAVALADVQVDRVVSLGEFGQLGAAYLAVSLGHTSPSVPLSILARDKSAMKNAARRAGVACARQAEVDRATPGRALEVVGIPAVLKPLAGMGASDTSVVRSVDELRARLDELDPAMRMVVEEYVSGDEYHVDAVWQDGRALELGVARYPVPCIEVTMPGHLNGSALLSEEVAPEAYDALRQLSADVNAALGIDDGITHAEFFHTPDGRWLFSEIATRPGGGAIPALYRSRGADLRESWLRSTVSQEPWVGSPQKSPVVGWVNIAPDEPGTVLRAPTRDEAMAITWVLDVVEGHLPGDVVDSIHPTLWSWMVLFEAESWEQYLARTAELEDTLTFTMAPIGDEDAS